jgi:hypothetical protein
MKQRIVEPWTLSSPVHQSDKILEKWILRAATYANIITHRYMHLCWEPQLLASALLATQGNKQVASAVQKDHIQMLSSWNQLNLLVTT